MKPDTLESIYIWFKKHVDDHREADDTLHHLPQLKVDHSLRVAKDCRDIALELGWTSEDSRIAESIGILHDTARFPQFKHHRTFLDHLSFDHGEKGHEIVQESKALNLCSEQDRHIILNGIRYHNRRTIPENLDEESVRMLKLIRDCDKLDIIHVLNQTIKDNLHDKYPEIMCNINLEGPATPQLVNEIKETKTANYKHVNTLIDMHLMRMAWIYDINYKPSFQKIVDRKLLIDLTDKMTEDDTVAEIVNDALQYLEAKLAEPF